MSGQQPPTVGYHIAVTALHHDQRGALEDGPLIASAVSEQPTLVDALAELLHDLGGGTGRQWSVRHPDGCVDGGGFTEVEARRCAVMTRGEAVCRVVGPWRAADPDSTN